jgi:hypothetical protein
MAQGCEQRLWREQTSSLGPHNALEEAISFARSGDSLVVTRTCGLARLGIGVASVYRVLKEPRGRRRMPFAVSFLKKILCDPDHGFIGDRQMDENRVVDLLAKWLSSNGYEIISTAHGKQQGDDIRARAQNGALLKIECKGSEPNGGGKKFDDHEKYQYAAYAFFNQMTLREREPQNEIGIAFPADDEHYRFRMLYLKEFFRRNSVRIFWVSEDNVNEW